MESSTSGAKRITITIPRDLNERLQAVKNQINISGVCQEAIEQAVANVEAEFEIGVLQEIYKSSELFRKVVRFLVASADLNDFSDITASRGDVVLMSWKSQHTYITLRNIDYKSVDINFYDDGVFYESRDFIVEPTSDEEPELSDNDHANTADGYLNTFLKDLKDFGIEAGHPDRFAAVGVSLLDEYEYIGFNLLVSLVY